MKIQESAENYLESILVLGREKGAVRSIDVVQRMNFSKPSVSRAMGLLRQNGYVTMDKEGFLELTERGREIAERIYERHRGINRWQASSAATAGSTPRATSQRLMQRCRS